MPRKHIKNKVFSDFFPVGRVPLSFFGIIMVFLLPLGYISMQTVLIFFNIMKLGIIPSNKMLSFRACLKARDGQVFTYTIHGF